MSKNVQVRNFPRHVKLSVIKSFFNGLKIKFIKMDNTGKGIIEFRNENDAFEATKKDSMKYKDKTISVKLIYNTNNDKIADKLTFPVKEEETVVEEIMDTGRLYIRNLSYEVTEAHIVDLFKQHGDLVEVSVPYDFINKRPKGFAFVTFMSPSDAVKAYKALNHTKLINHKIQILPASEKPHSEQPDTDIDNDVKKKFHEERTKELKSTASSAHNWNVMFVNNDVVAQFLADKLKISKSELFNDSLKGSMAVKLAQAETQLVILVQQFLEENGIQVDVLQKLMNRGHKSKTTINVSFALSSTTFIVKNLTPGVSKDDLHEIFGKFAGLESILLPPYGVTAIITYNMSQQAKLAYLNCAYMPMNDNVLMLQWAPIDIFKTNSDVVEKTKEKIKRTRENEIEVLDEKKIKKQKISKEDTEVVVSTEEVVKPSDNIIPDELRSTKLILKNLAFQATKKELYEYFGIFNGLQNIRLPLKNDEGHRGFAFIEFETEDDAQTVKETVGISTHLLGRRMILEYSEGV